MDKYEAKNKVERILMEWEKPSVELRKIMSANEVFSVFPWSYLWNLKDVMQNKKHHPEGDVLTHTFMVVDEAATRRGLADDKHVFMWSALLHDIGKLKTTKKRNGRITAYDHDKVGAEMAEEFLDSLDFDEEFKNAVIAMVRWHMQPLFVVNKLPFAQVQDMKEEIDVEELSKLSICDRLGRRGMTDADKKKEKDRINQFKEIVGRK